MFGNYVALIKIHWLAETPASCRPTSTPSPLILYMYAMRPTGDDRQFREAMDRWVSSSMKLERSITNEQSLIRKYNRL